MLNFAAFLESLPIMVKGMGGIFVVIALIYLTVAGLNRITKQKEKAAKD